MKKINIILVVLLMPICLLLASCDLSHKHYLDKYGVCKSCQADTAILLSRNGDGNYVSDKITANTMVEGFVKFVSNGENGIKVTIEGIDGNIKLTKMSIIKEGDSMTMSAPFDSEKNTLTYNNSLIEGKTYYISFLLKDSPADVIVKVSEIN